MSKEQSAIDAIYNILDEISNIKKQILIIDSNIKLLNNKVGKIISKDVGAPSAIIPPTSPQQPNSDPSEYNKLIKVFGRVKNQRKKPIRDVYIKIFTPKGEVIKSRTTDSDGYWEARLNPGHYCVELNASHINNKFKPINKNIFIEATMNEFEVK